jgi:ketosteroid isomerase-like protein
MSQDDVETLKRAIEAVNRGDVEGLLATLDPDVEWHPGLAALLGGEATGHRGHEGVRQWLQDVLETFAEFHVELSEILDLEDRLVAVGRIFGRGAESGADTESPAAYLIHLRDGKAIVVRIYLDPEEALRAAGLRE